MQPNNIPSALRHQVVSASQNKRAKFQKRSTEAGSELVGESKATLVGESKARSMSPAATRPDTKRAEVCGLPSGRRRCVEVPWRGDALSQPSAMALRTMAPLTTALYLPWPDLLWLHLLWAATVPAQRVCLIEVAEPEVVANPRDAPIDLRILGARVATAQLLVRAGLGQG